MTHATAGSREVLVGKNRTKLEKIRRNEEYALKYKKRKKKPSSGSRAGAPPTSAGRVSSRPDFPAVCSACAAPTTLPFEPTNGKPVYCRPCFTAVRA